MTGVKTAPTCEQELFEFAIDQRRRVIGEFLTSEDYWKLTRWAKDYAESRGLILPVDPEIYGFFYELDAEDISELKEKGLWVDGLDWSKL